MGDTRDTRFDDAAHLASARWNDWTLVLAAGADDGLSLLALLPDGRLLHLDSLADSAAATLANVGALAATVIGDALVVLATSGVEPGISQFRADLSDLGEIRQGTGAGADMFVFRPGQADPEGWLGHVLDFDPAEDRLDLSTLPFLYDIGQVTVDPAPGGAILRFGALWLEVTGAAGTVLTAETFTTGMILNAQHLPMGNVAVEEGGTGGGGPGGEEIGGSTGGGSEGPGGEETGGTGGDGTGEGGPGAVPEAGVTRRGGGAADRLEGGAGADVLLGLAGNDHLTGGDGADMIDGGTGSDTINGGPGDDTLIGGASGGICAT